MHTKCAYTAIVASLLTACTIGPNFTKPVNDVPPAWHDVASSSLTNSADPDPNWWVAFNDPELSALIDRATRGNIDLKIEVVRIDEARAQEIVAGAAAKPSVDTTGSYARQKISAQELATFGIKEPGGFHTEPFGEFQGAVDASWELDLFGKVRRSVEAANAATSAAFADRDNSLVALQAEVAQTYSMLRAAQENVKTSSADIDALKELLSLTGDRTSHGLTSDLDVQNARSQLASTQAQLPQYIKEVATYLNSLAVLVGEPPGTLDAELNEAKPIPQPSSLVVPIGLPSQLARRRPDIREAEDRLRQQNAEVGEAIAALYPDITLTGDVGQLSQRVGALSKSANNFWSIGPSLSLPIFEGGKLRANIKEAKAEELEASLTYRKTVLTALEDVENSLAAYRTDRDRLTYLVTTVEASQAAVDIARDRYRHGLGNYLDVLTPENTLIQAQQQLINARLNVTTDMVTIYKSLGGGWQSSASRTGQQTKDVAANEIATLVAKAKPVAPR